MWRIDIFDIHRPNKIRLSYYSKLPTKDRLVRRDRFAVMTRVTSLPVCDHCKRRANLAAFVKKQQDIRATFGNNVILFPITEARSRV